MSFDIFLQCFGNGDPTVPAESKGMAYFEEARSVLIHCGADIDKAIASS
jgi:hypothetical protein